MYINTRPFLHTPQSETKRYQKEIMSVLTDIDRLSVKHNIDYTIEAGTALGAARHEGFIPWDNDADILVPNDQVQDMLLAMAREGYFKTYEIWYYSKNWSWLIKDKFIARILEDPDNYCEISLKWAIGQITHAVFRIVRKETVDITMSLSKGTDTYQVAHFDTTLSTASLQYKFMTADEKRTWRERYLLEGDTYRVHPFVDVFPVVEMTPEDYIKMKNSFKTRDRVKSIESPRKKIRNFVSNLFSQKLANAKSTAADDKFEDYRVGVNTDYVVGVEKARSAQKKGDNVVLSKAPWNLKKIIPYEKSEIYPPQRVPFEGTELNAPNRIIDVLNNHYKDYTQMPPENERIQHVYHLDPHQFKTHVPVNE